METSESLFSQKQNKNDDETGQSTVEFALTMIMFMGFVFFFMQLSLVFSFGNYVHYATFMSARAYLSAGREGGDQMDRARSVAVATLKKSAGQAGTDKFPIIAKGVGEGDLPGFKAGPGDQYQDGDIAKSWMQGVRYTFRSKLFLIPLAGRKEVGAGSSANSVTLTSESWLGREPSADECQRDMGKMKGLFDNGC